MPIIPTFSEQINNLSIREQNKKFGFELPTPFIEKFEIKDDGAPDDDGPSFEVQASVYLNLNHYGADNIDDVKNQLNNINTYIVLAFDRDYKYVSGSEDVMRDSTATNLLTNKQTILSALTKSLNYYNNDNEYKYSYLWNYTGDQNGNIFSIDTLNNWQVAETFYLDGSNLPIVKMINSTTIPQKYDTDSAETNQENVESTIIEKMQKTYTYNNFLNMGAFAFSTILDLTSQDYVEVQDSFNNNKAIRKLYDGLTSDINPLMVVKDKEINESLNTVFIDEQGTLYYEAVQSLDNFYYTNSDVKLNELVAFFKVLASTSDNETLQSMYDSYLTLLETNDMNESLILEINQFLDTFTEKSSATQLGRFYLRLQKRLIQANKIIKDGIRVEKTQLTNPIIIDRRGETLPTESTWNTPQPDNYEGGDYIYINSVYLSRHTVEDLDQYYFIDQGYVFFDFQKALMYTSKIAQYLDPRKIIYHLGQSVVMSKFYVDNSTLVLSLDESCRSGTSCSNEEKLLTLYATFYDNSTTKVNSQKYMEIQTHTDDVANNLIQQDPSSEQNLLGNTHYAIRNFNTVDASVMTEFNNNLFYYLMCLNFKIITLPKVNTDSNNTSIFSDGSEKYTFEFEIKDSTDILFFDLHTIFRNAYDKLVEYKEYAEEACSYNDADGWFNEFFINGVLQYYDENSEIAPWISVPYAFVLMQDMFYNSFNGDKQEMQDKARKLSDTISPYSGDLQNIEDFMDQYETLLDSIFEEFIDAVGRGLQLQEDTVEFSKEWCDFENTYMNNPFASTESEQDAETTEEDQEETESVSWTKKGALTYTYGIWFGDGTGDNDAKKLYEDLQKKFSTTFGGGLGDWSDTDGSVWDDIVTFIQANDTSGDSMRGSDDFDFKFTTPKQNNNDEYVTYLVCNWESEGKVKIREYRISADDYGDDALNTAIYGTKTINDDEWDIMVPEDNSTMGSTSASDAFDGV